MCTIRTLMIGLLCSAPWVTVDVGPVEAQATPQGVPFTVNSSAPGDQDLPAVAAAPDGGFAVVWRTREAGLEGVAARLLDPAGVPLADDVVLEAPQAAEEIDGPRIVARDDGEIVAAWFQGTGHLFIPEPIKIRRFDPDGRILGDLESPEADGVGQPPLEHDLAAFDDGGLALVWRQGPGDAGFTNEQVYARLYDPDGEPEPAFQVNTSDPFFYGAQVHPSVTTSGDEFVVVWEDRGFTFPGRGRAIAFRRYTSEGPLGRERYLEPAFTAADERSEPRVAAHADGSFVVTWTERAEPMSDLDVWAQRFARPEDSASPVAGEPFRVNPSTTGDQQAPDVAMDAEGNFVIVWRSDLASGGSLVEGRLYHRFALSVDEFVVAGGVAADARPSVAFADGGRILVAWHAPGVDGGGTDVAGRRYQAVVPPCVEDPRSLCLQQDRFRVEVAWRDFAGATGPGRTVPFRSDDSGLFWFFSPSNWEILVKVLDGCDVTGFYWVFAAATTNVEYTLTVTDTETGDRRDYFNPLGVSSAAITDTSAFATCGAAP